MPSIIAYNARQYQLLVIRVDAQDLLQRSVHIRLVVERVVILLGCCVELSSDLVEVWEEVGGVVHRHIACRGGVKQGEVFSGTAERLHVHGVHDVAKALVHVHVRGEKGNVSLSHRR